MNIVNNNELKMISNGFTLAELLISLLILSVIATFTIPKVITSSQNGQKKAITKEIMATIAGAYDVYKMNNSPNASFKASDLSAYINYVKLMTSNEKIDLTPADGTSAYTCTSSDPCLKLANGGVLAFYNMTMAGTSNLNVVSFIFDPDGTNSGISGGSGKAIELGLYFNGRIVTWDTYAPNSTNSWGGPFTGCGSGCDPSWFSW